MLSSKLFCYLLLVCLALIPYGQAAATPDQPGAPAEIIFVGLDAGYAHTCAITDANRLVCWGDNYEGQLARDNSDLNDSPIPLEAPNFGTTILSVSAGGEFTCAIRNDSTAWCWGYGEYGQLGDGLGESSYLPVQVAATTGFVNATIISAGFGESACGLTSDGATFCWGEGGAGQLGNGANDSSDLPVAVSTLSAGVKDIYVGASHVCAVNNVNGAVCWGANYYGTLGNAANTNSNVPVAVSGLSSGVTQVAAGDLHSCALVGGAVKCWGYGGDGALGNGSFANSNIPVQVSGITSGATAITAGSYHTCALVNGGVKCWGYNSEGQLGNNTILNSNVPVQVTGLTTGVTAISAGGHHTCALLNTSEIKCWGYNGDGELGTGDMDSRLIPGDTVMNLTGCVSGYPTYLGKKFSKTHEIFVTAHPTLEDPPVANDVVLDGEYYLLSELPDGAYYISAFLDANDSGGGPPDPGEPTAWYDANNDKLPDTITISGGVNVADIRIYLYDPRILFLPLVKK